MPNVLMAQVEQTTTTAAARWPARLELAFSLSRDKTVVHSLHRGPMRVQRPFHPEPDGTCHTYILHPPGGVVGGDTLELDVKLAPGARCVLTAPGATKFYRAPGPECRQHVRADIADGAVCEYLPTETIVFDGANAHNRIEVHLAGNATFVGWDIVSLGRPAANEAFARGSFTQRHSVHRDGRPIWFERARFDGGAPALDSTHGLQGHPIYGTMIYAGALPEDAGDKLRDRLAPVPVGMASVSQLRDVLVCRFAGPKVSAAHSFFGDAWNILRKMGQGKPASRPRIWAT
jgi:urease accessory protein